MTDKLQMMVVKTLLDILGIIGISALVASLEADSHKISERFDEVYCACSYRQPPHHDKAKYVQAVERAPASEPLLRRLRNSYTVGDAA
ncbi:MAG TPA: hypothetical protein VH349_13005 [Ktedonobacterales bacterium]